MQRNRQLRQEARTALEHRSARLIQNVFRQKFARGFVQLLKSTETKAAMKIQRAGRGRAARLLVRHKRALKALARLRLLVFPIGRVLRLAKEVRRNAVRKIERYWLQTKMRRYMYRCRTKGRTNSIVIQRLFRGYIVRLRYLETKTRKMKAVYLLQRIWRGVRVRLRRSRRKLAAMHICHHLREVNKKFYDAARLVQSIWRGKMYRRKVSTFAHRRFHSIRLIQAASRRYQWRCTGKPHEHQL